MERVANETVDEADDELSMAAWSLPGRPVVMFFATLRKRTIKTRPRTSEKNIESTLTAQKLPAQSFQTHSPSTTAHLQIGEVVLDVFAGSFPVTARMFFFHSSALRHRLCARPVTDQQGAEHHELCRDEAREHGQRRNRPHETKNHTEQQRRQQHLADLAEPRRSASSRRALSSRLGFSSRAAKNPFGTDRDRTAEQRRHRRDLAHARPTSTAATARLTQACASNVNGTTCFTSITTTGLLRCRACGRL